jgi:chorismate-pyruvate lyase
MKFSYKLVDGWHGAQDGSGWAAGLKPHELLLLFSDGSMTLDLELLFGARVEVEMISKGFTPLSVEAAGYIGEPAGKKAMEREVWLTVNGRRLIYAHTLIPLDRLGDGLLEALEEKSNEPLGRVLASKKIFFTKTRLEAGLIESAAAANGFEAPEGSRLMSRRYILEDSQDGRWVIKAALMEVFSPGIIHAPAVRINK